MTTRNFLTLINGIKYLVQAINVSAGVADAAKIICSDATGKLDASFLPTGVDVQVETVIASEALSAGNFVNFWVDAGVRKVRQAGATNLRPAHGFVLTGFATNANAAVYASGINSQLTSLTPGAQYFLTTAGTISTNPPAIASNNLIQIVGIAISPTALRFEFDDPVYIQ